MKEKLLAELIKHQERITELTDIAENKINFKFINKLSVRAHYNQFDQALLFLVSDYDRLQALLKYLRKTLGVEMPMVSNWYSCGVMLFKWGTKHVTIRFECLPDDIPKELMPSADCVVQEIETVEKTYAIVCPVKGD